ncbi:MAG: hypothetical protein ABIM99_06030 [Candidatus Dojkabacteria bacterium]
MPITKLYSKSSVITSSAFILMMILIYVYSHSQLDGKQFELLSYFLNFQQRDYYEDCINLAFRNGYWRASFSTDKTSFSLDENNYKILPYEDMMDKRSYVIHLMQGLIDMQDTRFICNFGENSFDSDIYLYSLIFSKEQLRLDYSINGTYADIYYSIGENGELKLSKVDIQEDRDNKYSFEIANDDQRNIAQYGNTISLSKSQFDNYQFTPPELNPKGNAFLDDLRGVVGEVGKFQEVLDNNLKETRDIAGEIYKQLK